MEDAPERLRVFEIARGRGKDSVAVELPTAWARAHVRVEVELTRSDDEFGWHAQLVGEGQACLMGFPWYDHVEAMLVARNTSRLPIDLEEGAWDDVEQGWWAAVIPAGPWVFLAETDFDALVDAVRDPENMATSKPGVVTVDGVDIRWARVDRDAYDQAWSRATAQFSAAG